MTFVRCRPCALVVRPHQQQTGQLTRRAGGRRQRDGAHAGDGAQRLAERAEHLEPTLRVRRRRRRVHVAEAAQAGGLVAQLRVVLHGARTRAGRRRGRRSTAGASAASCGRRGRARTPRAAPPASTRRCSAGTSSSSDHSGVFVVRSGPARRPSTDNSKIVGSISRPTTGADDGAPRSDGFITCTAFRHGGRRRRRSRPWCASR